MQIFNKNTEIDLDLHLLWKLGGSFVMDTNSSWNIHTVSITVALQGAIISSSSVFSHLGNVNVRNTQILLSLFVNLAFVKLLLRFSACKEKEEPKKRCVAGFTLSFDFVRLVKEEGRWMETKYLHDTHGKYGFYWKRTFILEDAGTNSPQLHNFFGFRIECRVISLQFSSSGSWLESLVHLLS